VVVSNVIIFRLHIGLLRRSRLESKVVKFLVVDEVYRILITACLAVFWLLCAASILLRILLLVCRFLDRQDLQAYRYVEHFNVIQCLIIYFVYTKSNTIAIELIGICCNKVIGLVSKRDYCDNYYDWLLQGPAGLPGFRGVKASIFQSSTFYLHFWWLLHALNCRICVQHAAIAFSTFNIGDIVACDRATEDILEKKAKWYVWP